MAIHPRLKSAVEEAVRNAGQSQSLAQKIIAWLEAIASGNEELGDRASAERHVELLYEETSVELDVEDL